MAPIIEKTEFMDKLTYHESVSLKAYNAKNLLAGAVISQKCWLYHWPCEMFLHQYKSTMHRLIRMYFNSLHFHDAWPSTSTNVCTIFSHLSVFLSRLELLNRNIWDDITIWTIYNITICCVKYWQKGRAWIVDFGLINLF